MQQFQTLKGRSLVFLLFTTFLWFATFTARTIFSPVLPFMVDDFGISHAKASSVFIPLVVGYAVSLFLSGVYAKLFSPKKLIVISVALAAFACFIIPFFKIFEALYFSTFLIGVAGGIYLPSMVPYLTTYYNQRNWGKVIVIHDTGAGISLFMVPFLATALLTHCEWREVFLVIALTLTSCAVIFSFVAKDRQGPAGERHYLGGNLWRRKEVWFMGIVGAFVGGATIGLYFIIPLYLVKELGMAPSQANTILGVSRIGGVLVAIPMGYLVDRFSPRRILFTLAFCTGVATMFLVTRDVAWITICFFIQACFAMGFMSIKFFGISKLFEEEERGQATGILLTVSLIFGGVIPYLLGLSGDLLSFRLGIFLLGAITTLASGLILFLKKLG